MKPSRFTVLDWIVALVVCSIVGVVFYRYRTQGYFDLYGLLIMVVFVAGYFTYRQSPRRKKEDLNANAAIPDEKKG